MFPHKISINQRAAAGKLPLLEPMCREKHRKVALIRICEGYGKKKNHPIFTVSMFAPLNVEE